MSSVVDNHLIDMEPHLLKACKEQRARIAELEAALREIEAELVGAHDGGCILPVREIVNRVLRKE